MPRRASVRSRGRAAVGSGRSHAIEAGEGAGRKRQSRRKMNSSARLSQATHLAALPARRGHRRRELHRVWFRLKRERGRGRRREWRGGGALEDGRGRGRAVGGAVERASERRKTRCAAVGTWEPPPISNHPSFLSFLPRSPLPVSGRRSGHSREHHILPRPPEVSPRSEGANRR